MTSDSAGNGLDQPVRSYNRHVITSVIFVCIAFDELIGSLIFLRMYNLDAFLFTLASVVSFYFITVEYKQCLDTGNTLIIG